MNILIPVVAISCFLLGIIYEQLRQTRLNKTIKKYDNCIPRFHMKPTKLYSLTEDIEKLNKLHKSEYPEYNGPSAPITKPVPDTLGNTTPAWAVSIEPKQTHY